MEETERGINWGYRARLSTGPVQESRMGSPAPELPLDSHLHTPWPPAQGDPFVPQTPLPPAPLPILCVDQIAKEQRGTLRTPRESEVVAEPENQPPVLAVTGLGWVYKSTKHGPSKALRGL